MADFQRAHHSRHAPDGLEISLRKAAANVRRAIMNKYCNALDKSHSTDYAFSGPDGFSRPEGFSKSQRGRFAKRSEAADEACRPVEGPIVKLDSALPDEGWKMVFHGDCRLGSLIYRRSRSGSIAIFDRAQATTGSPLPAPAYGMLPRHTAASPDGSHHNMSIGKQPAKCPGADSPLARSGRA